MKKKPGCITRHTAILLLPSLLVVCIFAACQPTPSTPPVIGRQEDILKSVTAAAYEKIETPQHVSETYDDFIKLKLTFDADVAVPDATAYPVTEATKRVFSDDDILSYIKFFSGENDEIYSEWNLTKEEWMEKINEAKPYVESGKVLQQWLDTLHFNYDNANTEVKNSKLNIYELPNDKMSKAYVQNADNTISLFAFRRGENFFAYYRDMYLEGYPASLFDDFNEESDTIEHFTWMLPGEPEITQEEAHNEALKYINKMGIGLNLYYAEPCTVLVNQVEKSTGWQFTFTRAISDLQAQYNDIGIYVNNDALPSYGAPWEQEICRLIIDRKGLCSLWWQGASAISSTAVESAQLESFETIKERIASQLNYMYGTHENSTGSGLDIKITAIELGISLISQKDKTESGIYIPTWYVDFGLNWSDSEDIEADWDLNQIILSALDASYIEPRVTNTDLMSMMNNGGLVN